MGRRGFPGPSEKRLSDTELLLVSVPNRAPPRVFVGMANVDVTAPEIESAGTNRVFYAIIKVA